MYTAFLKKKKVAADAYSFYFRRDFDFIPGQYIEIVFNTAYCFSIASSPTETGYFMITTKIRGSDFKKKLMDLQPDEEVEITGPKGRFILNEKDKSPHVFLAGGIGITPFRSMVVYLNDKNLDIPVTLFTSFRTPEDIVFEQELRNITFGHPHIKLVETITQPEESKIDWPGHKGRLNATLLQTHIESVASSLFYIAGPPAMVKDLVRLVESLGIMKTTIRKEEFEGY